MAAARFLSDDFVIKEKISYEFTSFYLLPKKNSEKCATLLHFVRIKSDGWVRSMADSTQRIL
jgi:hypothetical protein